MAQSKYIQSVVKASGGRPKSTQWYRDKIREFGKPGAMDLIRDGRQSTTPHYGRINMFFYYPSEKEVILYLVQHDHTIHMIMVEGGGKDLADHNQVEPNIGYNQETIGWGNFLMG